LWRSAPARVTDEGKVIPLEVRVDDYVLVGKDARTEIKLDGVEHRIRREDEVLGVAEGVHSWS
jgi:chaperonin GroES